MRAFERLGYRRVKKRGKGSHVFMKREGSRSLTIPLHDELAKGTLASLIDASGHSVEEFRAAL